MRLPGPVYSDGLRKMTQVRFYGYDAMGTEGGIRDMQNMTSDYWPELASRPVRHTAFTATAPRGLAGGDALVYIDGTDLHVGDAAVEGLLAESDALRSVVRFGDYIVVWPDKAWYDTVSGESGSIDESVTVTLQFGSMPGRYSSQSNAISAFHGSARLPEHFKAGDAVTLSGCERHPANNKTAIVREVWGEDLLFLDDTWEMDEHLTYTVPAGGLTSNIYNLRDAAGTYKFHTDDFLPAMSEGDTLDIDLTSVMETMIMTATIGGVERTIRIQYGLGGEADITMENGWGGYIETATVTVSRTAPDLDGIFAHENRLYGWKGDTIYASKWGDLFNWEVFDGTASDSWTTETGTPGPFTGGASFAGYPRFFKRDRIFTLYGDYPSEYQMQEVEGHGVLEGCARSLAAVSGRLMYLSPAGPCLYAGGEPSLAADAFGLARYKNAAAGTDGVKYFISMQDGADAWHLFVYDMRKGLWMREDDTQVLAFATVSGTLYALTAGGDMLLPGRPVTVPAGASEEGPVAWYAEFGDMTAQSPVKKRVTKLVLRMEMERDSEARIFMLFDSDGDWREAAHVQTDRKRSVVLPIVPRRADHFRLRLTGRGGVRISSLAIEAAAGSDR